MRIAYCLQDSTRTGGMERIVCTKANYLSENMKYDVYIITTDRSNSLNYYNYSPKVKFINLAVDYAELKDYPFWKRIYKQLQKRKLHRDNLTKALYSIHPSIVISTYMHEFTLLPFIEDGSHKIAEIHFPRRIKSLQAKNNKTQIFNNLYSVITNFKKQLFIKYYKKFIVLSKQEVINWGNKENIDAIPNCIPFNTDKVSSHTSKRAISVGRLAKEKGFDKLIKVWALVHKTHPDWNLDIFGEGEELEHLTILIHSLQLENVVKIHTPVKNILDKYLDSSIYIMTSSYEGFGLVLTEAMICGLPCISFNCPSGPSEIIRDGEDGFLVNTGDMEKLLDRINYLIENKKQRMDMGIKAKENISRYLPEEIMPKWDSLFNKIFDGR